MDCRIKIFIALIILMRIPVAIASEKDIGLRVYDDGKVVKIAVKPIAESTSPLRICKGEAIYGVELVTPTHPAATHVRIRLPSGATMALKRACGEPWYPGFGTYKSTTGVYTFGNSDIDWSERQLVNCWAYSCAASTCCTCQGTTRCWNGGCSNSADLAPVSCTYNFAYRNPGWIVDCTKYTGSYTCGDISANLATRTKVCQMQGYTRAIGPVVSMYYSSGEDDTIAYWNATTSAWGIYMPAGSRSYTHDSVKCDCN